MITKLYSDRQRTRGHVTPFGQAPLDFGAQIIVDRSAISP